MYRYDLKRAWGLSHDRLNIEYSGEEVSVADIVQTLVHRDDAREVIWLEHDANRHAKSVHHISKASMLKQDRESVMYLDDTNHCPELAELDAYIQKKGMRVINTSKGNWERFIGIETKKKWRVNVLGLGDVGGTLLMGLRLLGSEIIGEIGIFDLDPNRRRRWALELSQILDPNVNAYPRIIEIEKEDLFDCDMFVFCASRSVPEVGANVKDVRMIQFESNSAIIAPYAQMAREQAFEGVFAVVSDPVDQLCYKVYDVSNRDADGKFDGLGLRPEQVRGYGLGVMFARASYYADLKMVNFAKGRAYGPHGKDLIVANDPEAYNPEISEMLTKLTVEANLEVRAAGYKPFIAPALSSGALSLINTMKGQWNDSTVMLDGVYIGCRNRFIGEGVEVEQHNMDPELIEKVKEVAVGLKAYV